MYNYLNNSFTQNILQKNLINISCYILSSFLYPWSFSYSLKKLKRTKAFITYPQAKIFIMLAQINGITFGNIISKIFV